jgi:hypothetical protein
MSDLTPGQQQELFAKLIAEHVTWLYSQGFAIRHGDFHAVKRDPLEHKANSQHYASCAADLNLFKDGKWLKETEDHAVSGKRWEALHPYCRWGGRWSDGDHYEVIKWRAA